MQFDSRTESDVLARSQEVERADNARRQARNMIALDVFKMTELDDPADGYGVVMAIRKYLCGK